ncbi:MAG: hypothetical protein IT434_18215, partial [Phycisphaerales bacterium]|nr:hypothetical protein [Phycisphaerales bacterium]
EDYRESFLFKLSGDVTIEGNIPPYSVLFVRGGDVYINGNIGHDVEIHLQHAMPKEPGFLGQLFGKKADTPSMKTLTLFGNADDFLKIDAPNMRQIIFPGDAGKALNIKANKKCEIVLGTAGSHFVVEKAASIKAKMVGEYSSLKDIGHLAIEQMGDHAVAKALSMTIGDAGKNCFFEYDGEVPPTEDFNLFRFGRLGKKSIVKAPRMTITIQGKEHEFEGTYQSPARQPFLPRIIPGGLDP